MVTQLWRVSWYKTAIPPAGRPLNGQEWITNPGGINSCSLTSSPTALKDMSKVRGDPLKLAENNDVGETDLRAINAWKKGIFCHTESVTICLLSHSGESLQNGQLELQRRNWYFARETHKDTAVSVWACQARFWKSTGTSCQLWSKPHAVFHGVCEIALTEVLATRMGVIWHSKKVSLFELYKLNPLSPHCVSIARKLMHCYTWGSLQIVTVCGNTVGRHS